MNKYFVLFLASIVYIGYSLWPKSSERELASSPVCAQTQKKQALQLGSGFNNITPLNKEVQVSEVPWQISEDEARAKWSIQDHHEIEAVDFDSPLGVERVYRFSQKGIPILGMEIRIKKELNGLVVEKDNTYRPISEIPVSETVLSERASQLPQELKRYSVSSIPKDSAVIYVRKNREEGELAFAVSAVDKNLGNKPTQLVLRVEDGQLLHRSFGRADFNF